METNSPRRTIREFRMARTGVALLLTALACGVARVATSDTSINSLLIIAVLAAVAGGTLLLRSGRHI